MVPTTERALVAARAPSNYRLRKNFLLHVHPERVHPDTIRLTYTWGLGLLTLLMFLILTITGALLMFYYAPTVDRAYGTMQDLATIVPYGRIVRNLHRWSAHAMVATTVLHLLRVFYTGAHKAPRQLNWVVGMVLLVLTLLLSFTGYLLPWDQLSYWAVTVSTNILSYAPLVGERLRYLLLGGQTVGQEALLRFYVLHVVVLPIVASILIAYHLWRIRRDGFLARSRRGARVVDESPGAAVNVPVFPRLLQIEVLWLLAALIVLLALSTVVDAPLLNVANAEHPPNPVKAPWYFVGLQELVSYSAIWGGIVIPVLLTSFLTALPYIERGTSGVGLWFPSERRNMIAIVTLFMLTVVGFTLIGTYFRGPNWRFYWPWQGWPGPL